MTRSDKIMRKYGGAFGRVKALLLVWSCVLLGASIAMLVLQLQGKASAEDPTMLPAMILLLLVAVAAIVFLFVLTLKKAKQKGTVSPVGLFFGMLYVGIATNLIICRPFTRLLWKLLSICTFGLVSGPKTSSSSSSGNFAERYIRMTDNEMFYLYNDLGSYALLASESANATTVEVWPLDGKDGYVRDSSDRNYRPW